MTYQDNWYRVLSIARSNAANNLTVSNELLEICDALNSGKELTEQERLDLSKKVMDISFRLAEQSKRMNFAVSKLAGAV